MLLQHSSQKLWCNVLEVKDCIIYFIGIFLLLLGFWGIHSFIRETSHAFLTHSICTLTSVCILPISWLWAPCLPPLSMELFLHGLVWQELFVAFRARQASERENFHLSCSPLWFLSCTAHTLGHSLGGRSWDAATAQPPRKTGKVDQGCPWAHPWRGKSRPGWCSLLLALFEAFSCPSGIRRKRAW